MPTWSKNHAECVDTWFALRMLEQTRRTFATAGRQKMKDLLFFNPTATAAARRQSATTLARQLHNVFVDGFGAELEAGVGRTQAVAAMRDVLVQPEMTVSDLAEVNDARYAFFSEDGV